jgi:hypothetical protein
LAVDPQAPGQRHALAKVDIERVVQPRRAPAASLVPLAPAMRAADTQLRGVAHGKRHDSGVAVVPVHRRSFIAGGVDGSSTQLIGATRERFVVHESRELSSASLGRQGGPRLRPGASSFDLNVRGFRGRVLGQDAQPRRVG